MPVSLSTMDGSALAFPGMEISLGYLEPALSPAHMILTPVLLDMKPMHKTEGSVLFLIGSLEKQRGFAGLGSPCLSHEAGEIWLNVFH